MRWLGVVDLETGCERALGEWVGVVTKEGVVIAQESVIDVVVRVGYEHVLMLTDHLRDKVSHISSHLIFAYIHCVYIH